jgi:hypothetical protein
MIASINQSVSIESHDFVCEQLKQVLVSTRTSLAESSLLQHFKVTSIPGFGNSSCFPY